MLRFHAGWNCGNCTPNEGWFIDDVLVASGTPPWVDVFPESGTIPAGSSRTVQVRMDATQLFGGPYRSA